MDISLLDYVVDTLRQGRQLEEKFHDHELSGKFKGFRECHIKPDWLLVYLLENDILTLTLVDTGTHSDIFKGSVKNFVALVKNGSFLVRITDMTILIEKEFIYGSSKRPNPTDYYRKQHYQCG